MSRRIVLAVLLAAGTALPAAAQGDADKGERVFNKCKACHAIDEAKNKVGPHLVNIFGREAGSLEGYNYSDAMKASGITWDHDTLAAYLADPKKVVPGGKMIFPGIRKEDQLADLIAYLERETGGN